MPEAARAGRSMRALLVISAAVPLVLFLAVAWYLHGERLANARAQVEQTVTMLEEHALRVFEAQQLVLDRVDQRMLGMTWPQIRASDELHRFMQGLARTSAHIDGIWLVTPGGRTANSADLFPMPFVDARDRDYYQALSARDELFFGEMILGKTKGTLNFNVSRRRSPRETFEGLILATVSLDYFIDFWDRISPYSNHVATLIRPDGEVLARSPTLGLQDELPRGSHFLTAIAEQDSGSYRARSAIDGVDRIYAYARVGEHSLFIAYGVAMSEILGAWYADLVPLGLIALCASALLFEITFVALRQTSLLGAAFASWRNTAGMLREEVDRRARAEDLVEEKERLLAELGGLMAERKAILDTMLEGVVAYDWNGEVIYLNVAGRKILQLEEGGLPTLARLARQGRIQATDGQVLREEDAPVARLLRGQTVVRQDLRLSFNGSDVVCRFSGAPLRDEAGGVTGAVLTFADITEQKDNEDRRTLLMNELDHRVRNMLATISAMVRLSSAGAPDKKTLVEILSGRIGALTRTHGLLTSSSWRGAMLRDIIRDEVQPYASDERLMLDGREDVILPPQDAIDFALVIHELATNAAKYGAWSEASGRVEISWELTEGEERRLRVLWREIGGPKVAPAKRTGFGSQLIRSAFRRTEGAGVDLRLEPDGAVCEITILLQTGAAQAPLAPPKRAATAMGKRQNLAGLKVLLVEDEAVVRLELVAVLGDAGAEVLGPASSRAEGYRIAGRERPDIAVLDINLAGETAAPLAEALARRNVPLIFTSGYRDLELLPEGLRDRPLLQKPVSPEELIAALADHAPKKAGADEDDSAGMTAEVLSS